MIPTAEEFFKNGLLQSSIDEDGNYSIYDIQTAMIEFAKLHVEAALQAASKKAETIDTYKTRWNGLNKESYIEKDIYPSSILYAYSLTNIK